MFRHLGNFTFINSRKICVMGEGYGGYLAVRTMVEDSRLASLLGDQGRGRGSLVQCGAGVGGVSQWQRHRPLYTRRMMGRPVLSDNWGAFSEADITR